MNRDPFTNCPEPPRIKVRRSKSALLYLRMLDVRGSAAGRGCKCSRCLGEAAGLDRSGQRDRRYGMPKRYGMKTTVTTRRFDRVDPVRSLY